MWFYFLLGGFFIAIGLAVHVFKAYFLIAGYNTMPDIRKASVDTKGLGRLIGVYLYANGGLLIAAGIAHTLGLNIGIMPLIVFLGVSTVYLLVRAQKYDRNIYDENGKLRKGAVKRLALPVGIAVITVVFVAVLLFFSAQATKVTLNEEGVRIHGMYGELYAWESVERVELREDLPTIIMRTNGSALGASLKGHFSTKEYGSVKLFVNKEKPPFVYLKTSDGMVIFNLESADKTTEVFEEIIRLKELHRP